MDFIPCAESLRKITFSLKIRILAFFSIKSCVGSLENLHIRAKAWQNSFKVFWVLIL